MNLGLIENQERQQQVEKLIVVEWLVEWKSEIGKVKSEKSEKITWCN